MPVLTAVPVLAFVLLAVTLHGRQVGHSSAADWKSAMLHSLVGWGVFAAVSLELLSLMHWVRLLPLVVVWLLAALLVGLWGWRSGALEAGWASLRQIAPPKSVAGWALAGGLGALLASLLAVAFISPPNNVDSSLYHLARVMHWVQNGSLAHYAAKYHHQLNRPPFAEMAILHLRVLWGSDRPAALVQWFSLVASLVAVARISEQLNIGRWGRWVAMAFVLGLPMSMLQGSSTQNDLVVGLWVVVVLSLFLDYVQRPSGDRAAWFGAAVGLAMLTKATGYIYMLPFGLLLLVLRLRPGQLTSPLGHGAIMITIVVGLNLGFWARNAATYGSFLGGIRDIEASLSSASDSSLASQKLQADWLVARAHAGESNAVRGPILAAHTVGWRQSQPIPVGSALSLPESLVRPPGQAGSDGGSAVLDWLAGRGRKVLSDLMLHFVVPSSAVDQLELRMLRSVDFMFDKTFFNHRSQIAWNHEDTAGNPIQLALVLASLLLVFARPRWHPSIFWVYLSATVLGFGMVLVFGGSSSRWALRYHLPFFLSAGPLVAYAATMHLGRRMLQLLAGACLIVGLPWLLLNNTRPLIGMTPWPTRVESILVEDPARLMFATAPELQDEAEAAAAAIRSSSCRQVGLWLESKEPEYPIWWLLEAPQSGIQLKNVHTYDSLEQYLDTDFKPCAVLCTLCARDDSVMGLPLARDFGHYRIYANPDLLPPGQ